MATNVQSYSNTGAGYNTLTAEQAEYYQRTLLERLLPELFYTKYGEVNMTMPQKAGATTSWRRYNSLAVSTTEITDGVTKDGVDLNVTKVNTTVKQYGNYTKFTDFIELVGLDSTLTEASAIMGENAGESIDTIVRDVIHAGTNVMYANSVAGRSAVAAKMSEADVLKMRRNLKRSKVKPIKLPNGKMGYICILHPDVATDLMMLNEWKESHKYVDNKPDIEGFVGEWHGIYFIEAINAPKYVGTGAGSVDVYGSLVLGKGFYGVPDINGSAKPKIIVHKAGEAGATDALDQFNSVGWKACLAVVRLNELCGIRYECTATN